MRSKKVSIWFFNYEQQIFTEFNPILYGNGSKICIKDRQKAYQVFSVDKSWI